MRFIHDRPDWPRFRWDDSRLAPLLASVRYRQGLLLGKMQGIGFALRTETLLRTVTSDVVQSSAIEGEQLDPSAVRSSVARRLGLEAGGILPRDQKIEGVVEMMLDATQRFSEPLTPERLFGWHASLFPSAHSGIRRITVGNWRPAAVDPMQVVSGPYGKERIHFEAPLAERLPQEMTRLLAWFETDHGEDPILKTGVAHLWFVTIHPFEDGNGRIGRAIADMALARADELPDRFYSLSTQIERERKRYYEVLEWTQRGDLEITPWLEWFLECLGRAIDAAEADLSLVWERRHRWEQIDRHPINERQRSVLGRLMEGFEGKLTSSKYAKLAKCSADTALRDIKQLLEYGLLVQDESGGRSTSYSPPHPPAQP